jgi:hypothetical protein
MSDLGPLSYFLGIAVTRDEMDFISHRSGMLRRFFDGFSSPPATLAVLLSVQVRSSERNLELFSPNMILLSIEASLVRSCT